MSSNRCDSLDVLTVHVGVQRTHRRSNASRVGEGDGPDRPGIVIVSRVVPEGRGNRAVCVSNEEELMGQPATQVSAPLDGVRVLDLTRFPPGGYCTVMLADLGADVCRVVSPGARTNGLAIGLGRGKRSLALDLRHQRGNEILRRLACWADVLVESERPGAMGERGFGYAEAAVENPGLIWCSISGFGQDGPYATHSGHDLSYVAHSGLLAAVQRELPWYPEAILAIPTSGLMASVAVLAALRDRDRTGQGCQLDISISESATWMLSGSDGEISGVQRDIPIGPDRHLYECADGTWVAVASAEARSWNALCRGLELYDLIDTLHRWDDPPAVIARLAAAFATRRAVHWVPLLAGLGAAVVQANRGAELQRDPHVVARAALQEVDGVVTPRNPIRFRDGHHERPTEAPRPPSLPGADTEAVLGAAGLSADEIAELRDAGVIGST